MANPDHTKNLIPLNKRTPEERRAIQSKGGRTVTQKKCNAQKLAYIKMRMEKGLLRDGDEKWLLERLTNKDAAYQDVINWVDDLRKRSEDTKLEPAVLNAYANVLKTIHGEKRQLDLKIASVDLNQPLSDDAKRLLLGDWEE